MTNEELFDKLNKLRLEQRKRIGEIEIDFDLRRKGVLREWAQEHARFDIGDILQMENITIRVERFHGRCTSKPYVAYYGPVLTKKLQPRKDGFHTDIYDDGREIIKLNK